MDLTKKLLERSGYTVYCFLGLTGAKEFLAEHTPDGILIESSLPDGDGLDYCRELREENDVPILFFSNDRDDELPALQAGAVDFLRKPFDFEVLKARINIIWGARD